VETSFKAPSNDLADHVRYGVARDGSIADPTSHGCMVVAEPQIFSDSVEPCSQPSVRKPGSLDEGIEYVIRLGHRFSQVLKAYQYVRRLPP
jgi:hypothetical protein